MIANDIISANSQKPIRCEGKVTSPKPTKLVLTGTEILTGRDLIDIFFERLSGHECQVWVLPEVPRHRVTRKERSYGKAQDARNERNANPRKAFLHDNHTH